LLSANKWAEVYFACLLADKTLLIKFGGGYYRKEKVVEIQYAIVHVKKIVEYEVN